MKNINTKTLKTLTIAIAIASGIASTALAGGVPTVDGIAMSQRMQAQYTELMHWLELSHRYDKQINGSGYNGQISDDAGKQFNLNISDLKSITNNTGDNGVANRDSLFGIDQKTLDAMPNNNIKYLIEQARTTTAAIDALQQANATASSNIQGTYNSISNATTQKKREALASVAASQTGIINANLTKALLVTAQQNASAQMEQAKALMANEKSAQENADTLKEIQEYMANQKNQNGN